MPGPSLAEADHEPAVAFAAAPAHANQRARRFRAWQAQSPCGTPRAQLGYGARDWSWYEAIFPSHPRTHLRRSVPRICAPPEDVIRRIVERNPAIRVIYRLRDPIDRACPSMAMHFRKAPGTDVSEVEADEIVSFLRGANRSRTASTRRTSRDGEIRARDAALLRILRTDRGGAWRVSHRAISLPRLPLRTRSRRRGRAQHHHATTRPHESLTLEKTILPQVPGDGPRRADRERLRQRPDPRTVFEQGVLRCRAVRRRSRGARLLWQAGRRPHVGRRSVAGGPREGPVELCADCEYRARRPPTYRGAAGDARIRNDRSRRIRSSACHAK